MIRNIRLIHPLDAFGNLKVVDANFSSQVDGVHGLLDDFSYIASGTGAQFTGDDLSNPATAPTNFIKTECGTSSSGYCYGYTKKYLHYASGQGIQALGSVIFDTPIANNIQMIGVFNPLCQLGFGYNGTSLSVIYRTGAIQEVRTFTVTTRATSASNATVTLDGTSYTVPLTIGATTAFTAMEIASYAGYTGWNVYATGSVVTFISKRRGSRSGSYTYDAGTTGSAVTIAQLRQGSDFTQSNIIAQANFNGDKLQGSGTSRLTYDRTKLNVFLFQYGYLGGAPPAVYILGDDSNFHLVHMFAHNNVVDYVNFINPSMYFGWWNENSGNTTNLIMKGASGAMAYLGNVRAGHPQGVIAQRTGIATSSDYVAMLSIRMAATLTNRVAYQNFKLKSVSASCSNASGGNIVVLLNPTFSATKPLWQSPSANSVIENDTTGTTVTGGTVLGSRSLNNAGNIDIEWLETDNIDLQLGDVLTVAYRIPSGANYSANVSITGKET